MVVSFGRSEWQNRSDQTQFHGLPRLLRRNGGLTAGQRYRIPRVSGRDFLDKRHAGTLLDRASLVVHLAPIGIAREDA